MGASSGLSSRLGGAQGKVYPPPHCCRRRFFAARTGSAVLPLSWTLPPDVSIVPPPHDHLDLRSGARCLHQTSASRAQAAAAAPGRRGNWPPPAWLQLRTQARKKELAPADQFDATIDEPAGHVLTPLSGIPSRLFPRDLSERRRCDEIIPAVRAELA